MAISTKYQFQFQWQKSISMVTCILQPATGNNKSEICNLKSKIISSPKVQHFLHDAFVETCLLVLHE